MKNTTNLDYLVRDIKKAMRAMRLTKAQSSFLAANPDANRIVKIKAGDVSLYSTDAKGERKGALNVNLDPAGAADLLSVGAGAGLEAIKNSSIVASGASYVHIEFEMSYGEASDPKSEKELREAVMKFKQEEDILLEGEPTNPNQ